MWVLWFPLFGVWWWIFALAFFTWITIAEECEDIAWLCGGLILWIAITGIFGPTFYIIPLRFSDIAINDL